MIVIYNRFFPTKGYIAINILGVLFARKEYKPLEDWMLNHEAIHTRQMLEMLILPFYIGYFVEFFIELLFCFDMKKAYMNISFEKEAYANQADKDYLKNRKFLSFTKYL